MKKSKIIYLAILCVALGSCSKWLTINPQDQIKEGELYSSAEGFYTQINGVYKVMSEADLYGRELSFGMVEAMAQVYTSDAYTSSGYEQYLNVAKYSFLLHDRTKSMIDRIWDKSYNAITNCNSIIHYAIGADSMLFPLRDAERQLVLGEAYALRAMLHFDIFRLYAPSLKVNSTDAYVPYVKDFPVHIPYNTKPNDYMAFIIEDLEKAHDLTAAIDTSNTDGIKMNDERLELSGGGNDDRFISYRGYRLNHYAIKALLARVHMYAGNEEKALEYALQLIKLREAGWFTYDSSYSGISNGSMKLYGDVIFSLYNNFETKCFTDVCPYVDQSSSANYLSKLDYDGIFGAETGDCRTKQYLTLGVNKAFIKYQEVKDGDKAKFNNKMIPMLRMSEMYYIAAECLFSTNEARAVEYLKYVRGRRGCPSTLKTYTNKTEFISLILNDVRREQVGEGQLFFFYKRLNLPVITKGAEYVEPGENFYLPIPDSNNHL